MASKGKAPSMVAMDMKWRTEDDLRCLQQAAEIRKDKKRMAAARALAKEKLAAIKGIADTDKDGDKGKDTDKDGK